MKTIKIGLAGLGVVGCGVARNLHRNFSLIAERSGYRFEITKVSVRHPEKQRDILFPSSCFVSTPIELTEDPEIQVVVELMGGLEPARSLIQQSLRKGKAVVTANKSLLAEDQGNLLALATQLKLPLCFEASVAGGIPILKALREGLVANRIEAIHGIVNGTCNYILSSITQTGKIFSEALKEAQQLGFAEADPTLDVDGLDAMHKACILGALAYGFWADPTQVAVQGIRQLDAMDFNYAKALGYTIKLLAVIRNKNNEEGVELHVHPTLIPSSHVLASVSSSYNALAVRGDVVGETLFYGRGAGADATASAVISDLVEAAAGLEQGCPLRCCGTQPVRSPYLKSFGDTVSRHYVRLAVQDRPGVLAKIASVLGQHDIGISAVIQPKEHATETVPLVLIIDDALEKKFRTAIFEIEKLDVTSGQAVTLRVEDFES